MVDRVLKFIKNNLKIFVFFNLTILIVTIAVSVVKDGIGDTIEIAVGFAAAFLVGFLGFFGRYEGNSNNQQLLKNAIISALIAGVGLVAVFLTASIKYPIISYVQVVISTSCGLILSALVNIKDIKEL